MKYKISQHILLFLCVVGGHCDDPEVEIPQGRLRGGTRTNIDGVTYYSFESIPYAKPPLGELRYKPPEPAEGWEGIRDATEDLPQCVQISRQQNQPMQGQEDCLYLNVYTSALPGENDSKKPVMVWIHGGAFIMGSGEENEFGAQFLLSKDVILVAVNYRLGLFGFLSLDDQNLGVTGNAGNKDQILALKWVKENIEYFGGDPDNVLLFGQSAGGTNTHLHMLSPLSQGLFNKVILESGFGIDKGFINTRTRNTGVLLAEALGIQTENWTEMLASLQDVPAADLSATETILRSSYNYISSPLVEIAWEGAFLPDNPLNIIRSGDYNHVPFIIGFNNAEGLSVEAATLQQTGESVVITDFTAYIPGDLNIEAGSEEEAAVAERIKKFYYGDAEPSSDNITGAIELITDFDSGYPSYRVVMEHLNTARSPFYYYFFTADTILNPSKQGTNITYPGASHEDELAYLFFSSHTPEYEEGGVEDRAIRNMVNLWTNFAIYTNPTPDDFDNYKWQPVQIDEINYLHIDTEETTPKVNPKQANFNFWSELYAEYYDGI